MDQQKQAEEVISRAVDKISALKTCLSTLYESQRCLNQSCSQVKEEIYSAISRQLEALRDREIWLLNQVDTVAQIKEEELQAQLITVTQQLGCLEEKLLLLQQHPDHHSLISALRGTLSSFDDLDLPTVDEFNMQFEAKGDKLRRKIHSFGSVSSNKRPRLASSYATHLQPSVALPTKFGDFSLANQNELFPVFSENTPTAFWLQDEKMSETSWHRTNPSCKPFSTKQNLSDWLLQGVSSHEESCQDEDSVSFKLTNLSIKDEVSEARKDSSTRIIEQMESILASPPEMWLCESEKMTSPCKPEAAFGFFSHLSDDFDDWIIASEDKRMEEKPSLCACVLSGDKPRDMDIENLADLLCVQSNSPSTDTSDYSTWLLRPQERSKTLPPVEKVCRANEMCQSFSECVCDENCAGNIIQRSGDKNSPWLIVEYGKGLFDCFDREFKSSDWLVPKQRQTNNQLDEALDREGERIPEKELESSKWLCEKSISETESCGYLEDGTSVDVSGQWLSKVGVLSYENSPLDAVIKYHSTLTVSDWLKPSKMEVEEKEDSEMWLLKKSNAVLQTDSNKWLVKENKADYLPANWSVESFQNWPSFSFTKVESDSKEGDYVTEKCAQDDWLVSPRPVC